MGCLGSKICYLPEIWYRCTVFFSEVLDLRLTKDWLLVMSSHFLFLYTMIVYSLIIVNSILNLSTTLFEYALFVYNKKRFLLL